MDDGPPNDRPNPAPSNGDDYAEEEEEAFIDMSTAIEVDVDDNGAEPMDDDDDDDDDDADQTAAPAEDAAAEDMARYTLTSHAGPLYAVSCHLHPQNSALTVLSGGGDDRSYLHSVVPPADPVTTPLSHKHTDSVSATSLNLEYVDPKKQAPKLAAVGSYDGAVVLYDPDTGGQIATLEGPSDVEWLAFHPKGGTVLLAGSISDGTVWMYHTPGGSTTKCLQVFVGHEAGVTAGSFTPDGKFALSAGSDGTLRVWAPRTGLSRHVFRLTGRTDAGPPAGLTCMAVDGGPDGQLVVVGGEDGTAHVCHIGNKKVVAALRHYDPPPEHQRRNRGGDGDGMEVDEREEEQQEAMSVEAVGFAARAVNPSWCATGGVDGVLKIWDLTGEAQCRRVCRGPLADGVAERDAEAGPRPGKAGGNDGGGEGEGGITRLRWHPTLPLVFAAYSDGLVRLWDARSGRLLNTLTGHTDMINDMSVQFTTDTSGGGGTAIVVTGSDDKTVKVFEVDVAKAVQEASSAGN